MHESPMAFRAWTDDEIAASVAMRSEAALVPRQPGEHFPTTNVDGEDVPDLTRIPPERWAAALRPLRPSARIMAASNLAQGGPLRLAALDLARTLPGPAPAAPVVAQRPEVPTRPAASRQVNLRLPAHQHEDLARAAALVGMRPTALARALVISGVNRTLAEHGG